LSRKDGQQESPILQRCCHIFDDLLQKVDPELAEHLHRLEIMPQIFLMRWLRLLFGREFSFDELLRVWDLLFAADPSLELVDYVCIAMLLRVRWQLLSADANEALTLLLRYPSPEAPYLPPTFVEDAVLLKSRLSVETGHQLISQYSGRAPRRISTTVERPSTPISSREDSMSRSPRFSSPFGSPASSTLESVFQDVARGVLTRGSQAVRDAMGEVRRNVQTFQPGRNSPLTKSLPGTGTAVGHRTKRSDASSTIAANVLRRINALEERNKQLAKMLEAAVSDLWEYQKSLEQEKNNSVNSLESLSIAIAKVQFVQAYLSDSSLLLPPDDNQSSGRRRTESEDSTRSDPGPSQSAPADADSQNPESQRKVEASIEFGNYGEKVEDNVAIASKPPMVRVSAPSPAVSALSQAISAAPKASLSPSHRPTLAKSSFSYMLGQAHEDPSSSFLNASPLTPNERRNRVGADKAFLFGDEEDIESDQSSSRGKLRGRPKAKGKGVTAQTEDIGLGDLSGTPEGD
jgi:TBC1 domain family protein 5